MSGGSRIVVDLIRERLESNNEELAIGKKKGEDRGNEKPRTT